jgi:hypothetical protein
MADDNVLTALEAFIAGFETRSETRPQMRTVGKVAKPPQPKQEAIDNNNSVKTRKTRTSSDSVSLREADPPPKKREKEEGREKDPKVSSTELVSGFSGSAVENIEVCRTRNEMRWHLAHGERVPRHLCAGCRQPIDTGQEVLDLADDNRVHLADGYRCLIAWGRRWRAAARAAIKDFERGPWGTSLDTHPALETAASTAVPPGKPIGKPVAAPSVSASTPDPERGIEP